MNKIFLLSHGLGNKYVNEKTNIKFFCEYLSKNNYSVAIIPNAKPKDDFACASRTQQVLAGVQSTIIDLNSDNANLLKNFDCVYISGGDPELLINVIKAKVGINKFINLIKNKVIIGQSAGSMIISSQFINYSEKNNVIKVEKFKGLGLKQFDKVVVPHFNYLLNTSPKLVTEIINFCNANNLEILQLCDEQCYEVSSSGVEKLW